MNFNCCLDPVIYFFAIKTYKKRVLSLFKDYLYTSGASSKMTAENSSSNTWEKPQLNLQDTYNQCRREDLVHSVELKKAYFSLSVRIWLTSLLLFVTILHVYMQ